MDLFPDKEQRSSADLEKLMEYMDSVNIAEDLDKQVLHKIGSEVKRGYDADEGSRDEWYDCLEDYVKLAKQVKENKTYPWPKASNVKYPLLSTAAMQFGARAYPSLVPSNESVVKARVIGKDPTGAKAERADRVSRYMSYQLMQEMKGWEEDMDKLLTTIPIMGTMFKKTYWDSGTRTNCSKLIFPQNLVVNYWAKCLATAERATEIIEMSPRVLKERQMQGLFLDVELGTPNSPPQRFDEKVSEMHAPGELDETTPYIILEQHTYFDLDNDGYPEPYIVTIESSSTKVLRIVARYDDDSFVFNEGENGDLAQIKPIQYYTKFSFIPNPDGGFYDIGFGTLLGPLNEAVNTTINQLIDSGTLHNMQAGFLGKGLKLKLGESAFKPGEWKSVNATGDDLKKQILPLPTKEPSSVLFQLMGTLITSGKELASVAEIFTGKMPGQNTPATTTMATVEQGMKVFTAVYKRIFRGLQEEFEKLYRLNSIYLDETKYVAVLDAEIGQADFNADDHDIVPGADPQAVSSQEKLQKAMGLMEMLPTGMLNTVEVVRRVLVAQDQSNIDALWSDAVKQTGQPPPPPPDPKMLEMQMKQQAEQQKMQMQNEQQQRKGEYEARDKQTQMAMKEQEHRQAMQHREQMNMIAAKEAMHKQQIFSAEGQQKLNLQAAEGQQKLALQREQARQKPQQKPQNRKSK